MDLQDLQRAGRAAVPVLTATWIAVLVIGTSVVGAAVVVLLLFVFSSIAEELREGTAAVVSTAGGVAGAAVVVGLITGFTLQRRTVRWRFADREPSPAEAQAALRLPVQLTAIVGSLWLLCAVVIALVTAGTASTGAGARLFLAVGLGGLTTAGVTYLLAERASRGVMVRSLQVAEPGRSGSIGVRARLVLTWLLTSAIPAAGVLLIVVLSPEGEGDTTSGVVFLATTTLAVGALATALLARAVGTPLVRLRHALNRVGDGDTDVEVAVDDASEIGQLQAAVNSMTAGLRERQRMKDLFGRHVGTAVAEHALEVGVTLDGEVRDVVALFVDVVDSTALATQMSPDELVPRLNQFFEAVVDAVDEHGGLLNKFEGDAALCVFGAPVPLDDPCDRALRAARAIRDAVQARGDLDLGVGVAGGSVFAGQLGSVDRLEYTVIGDAVNTAARLTDLAKELPGRIAVSRDVVEEAREDERERWRRHEETVLRGRDEPTDVWTVAESDD